MTISRDFLLVAGGRLITIIVQLAAIRAVTTFLSPEQYGLLTLLVAVQMFCGMFLINPVAQHINRHTHQWWDEGSMHLRLTQYKYYVLGVSITGGVVSLLLVPHASSEELVWVAASVIAMVFAATWNATSVPMLNFLGFRFKSVYWSVITIITGLLASILLIMIWPTFIAWFSGQAIGLAIGAFGSGRALRKYADEAEHANYTGDQSLLDKKVLFSFCLPLAIATGFMWLQLSGYRFVIELYWGLEQLGFVALGLNLAGQVMTSAESLIMQFFYPMFYKRISCATKEDEEEALSDLLNVLGPVYIILAGVIISAAPFLIRLLVDQKFASAILFVMLGAGIECCRALGNVFGNAAQITRKTRSLWLPYSIGAIIVFSFLGWAGMNNMGVIWIGIALVVGGVGMLFSMIFSMYGEVRFTLEYKYWLLGVACMVAFGVSAFWSGLAPEVMESILFLIIIAAIACFFIFTVLWKNPSLKRLLSVNVRGD